jgi:dipeptidyl aminopeptidase/acylaminoacyl peptidase
LHLPIWAFHGAEDTVVPAEENKKMVDAVNAAAGNAKLTIYPDQGHNICNLTFFNDEVYEWLLQQHRGKQTANTLPVVGSESSAR